MKNRVIRNILSLTFLGVLLSSCTAYDITFSRYDYKVVDFDTHEDITGENYVKHGNYSPLTFINVDEQEESYATFQEVYRSHNYLHNMNSEGVNKMIVVPIDFDDYECNRLTHGCKLSKTLIQNAFFGKEDKTQFESVASYFDKSSYGKFKLDGFVSDWFRLNAKDGDGNLINYEYLSRSSTKKSVVSNIYEAAKTWLTSKYGDLSAYYIDGDKNKGLPIYFIYSAPNVDASLSNDSALWAYTFNTGGVFAWSSFHMLNVNLYNQVETHTLIHETGHMLGLADYYATNVTKQYSLTGHVDMMDYSLGDETGYSKMLLNWTRPYHVTGTTTIKIKPFSSSGDLILLNDSWNNTAMDEYLLLEMYTPTGLNELDSRNPNPSSKLFSVPGIKLYHVDSRVAYFSPSKLTPISYVSEGQSKSSSSRIGIAHTNTPISTHQIMKNPLYELLDKDESIHFINGGYATDNTLFKQGDTFGVDTYKDFTFHTGNKLNYSFKVVSLNNDEATIEINKLA